MKKFFLVAFLFAQNLSAQHIFQKTYGDVYDNRFLSLEIINDTNIYVSGFQKEPFYPYNYGLLARLNSAGNIKWLKKFRSGDSYMPDIQQLSHGTFLATGSAYYCSPGCTHHMSLVNIDSSGNILWKKSWNANNGNSFLEKSFESSDNYIVSIGYSRQYWWQPQYDFGLKLLKSDLLGNSLWNKTYLLNYTSAGASVMEKHNGNYLVGGATSSSATFSDYDMMLMETDSAGNFLWAKGFGGPFQEYSALISSTSDGGLIIGCTSYSSDSSNAPSDILVVRLDSLGNSLWAKKYGDSKSEHINGMLRDTSGNYLLWGSNSSHYPSFPGRGFLFKMDENGTVLWSRLYDVGSFGDQFKDVKQVHDQLLICGSATSPLLDNEAFLIRTDWQGNSCNDTSIALPYQNVTINSYSLSNIDTFETLIDTFSLTQYPLALTTNITCDTIVRVSEINSEHSLVSAYPNPASDIITLSLEDFGNAEIIIYDRIGIPVFSTSVKNQNMLEINLASFSAGYYLLKVISAADKKSIVKKLIKL